MVECVVHSGNSVVAASVLQSTVSVVAEYVFLSLTTVAMNAYSSEWAE